MKKILVFLFIPTLAWPNLPQIGDSVLYKRWIKQEGVEKTIYQSREILSYDEKEKTFLVLMGQDSGAGWKYWNETFRFLDYSYGFFENCKEYKGTYSELKIELKTFEVCGRDQSTNGNQYIDWHAEIPFGLLRNVYKSEELEFQTDVVSFSH